jgi:hypothetical protein
MTHARTQTKMKVLRFRLGTKEKGKKLAQTQFEPAISGSKKHAQTLLAIEAGLKLCRKKTSI